jgi:hypothetical protein
MLDVNSFILITVFFRYVLMHINSTSFGLNIPHRMNHDLANSIVRITMMNFFFVIQVRVIMNSVIRSLAFLLMSFDLWES